MTSASRGALVNVTLELQQGSSMEVLELQISWMLGGSLGGECRGLFVLI